MKPSGIQVNKPVLAFLVVVILAVVWYLTSGSPKPETIPGDVKKGDNPVLEPPVKLEEGQSSGNLPAEGTGDKENIEVAQGNDEATNLKPIPNPVLMSPDEVEEKKVKVKAGTWVISE